MFPGPRMNGHTKHDRLRDPRALYETSTMLSSDLESTSFMDSEDDTASRCILYLKLSWIYLEGKIHKVKR